MFGTQRPSEGSQPEMAPVLLRHLASPVCVLIAKTNVDAQMKAIFLNDADIPAVAVDDISNAGYFALGALDRIHRPQVFVDKSRFVEAREFLSRQKLSPERDDENDSFCFHCGAGLSPHKSFLACPECHRLLTDNDEEAPPGKGAREVLTGGSFFQSIYQVGTVAMLLFALPALLAGVYAVLRMVIGILGWVK